MKIKILMLFVAVMAVLSSCSNNNPVDNGGNSVIQTYFISLSSQSWVNVQGSSNQWYQQFNLPFLIPSNENYSIIVFFKNEFDEWQSLPYTKVYSTQTGLPVFEVFSYSYKGPEVYITYGFTVTGAYPYSNKLDLKVVLLKQY